MIYLYAHNFQDSSDISLWNCWIEGTSPGERWAFLSIAEKEKEAIDDIISHDCGRIPTVFCFCCFDCVDSGRPKHQQPMAFRRCELVWAMMSSLYLFGSDFFLTNDFFFSCFLCWLSVWCVYRACNECILRNRNLMNPSVFRLPTCKSPRCS